MNETRWPKRKLLLVTYHFPPNNAIAAVRTGKMARYFVDIGWDVRVLTIRQQEGATVPVEIEPAIVTRTESYDVDSSQRQMTVARIEVSLRDLQVRLGYTNRDSMIGRLTRVARPPLARMKTALLQWPDLQISWRCPAIEAAGSILVDWRPDIIYASAPPVTSLLVGDDLSRRYGIPWVAEFRDLWVDDPYYQFGSIRRFFERIWEGQVIGRAAALVTVSNEWQDTLKRRFRKPVALVMNGYDPCDFPTSRSAPSTEDPLRILHTGHIYSGYRDPTPLFHAIRSLGPQRNDVTVEFIGTNAEGIADLAQKMGIEDRVIIRPPIAYKDSLASQLNADVLLHLQWNDPKEAGTIGGKLFEYLGARRPLLCIGYEAGSVAQIVGERKAGLVSNDPSVIAEQLRRWILAKKSGGVPALPDTAAAGLTRVEQFNKLARFLLNVVPAERLAPPHVRATAAGDSFGFRRTWHYKLVDTTGIESPVLAVIVDTEEGFDWRAPFSRFNRDVSALNGLHQAHRIFTKWGITPTYVLDYPVVESSLGQRLIGGWLDTGECEIGAHLHPWVNPPDQEEVNNQNSYPGNLPESLERAKLATLTEAIQHNFGKRPVIYRAGRYGLGPHSLAILEDLGYLIDVSIVPFTNFAAESGPNFTEFGSEPFWFGNYRRMLELPTTRSFVGLIGKNMRQFDRLERGICRRLRFGGLLARSGLLERITLTPEGIGSRDMGRLCESLIRTGQRVFTLSLHSPSLLPGNTEYVRNDRDLVTFLETMDAFFSYFRGTLRGTFASPLEIYRMLDHNSVKDRASPD